MGTKTSFMPVRLDSYWILLEARAIVEVMGPLQWLPLPQAGAHVPGVCAWRGRALAVVDLSRLLGTSRQLATAPPRTLVLDTPNGNLAVPVGEVRAVVWLDREQLRPVHATSLPYMKAELEDGDAVTPVLDLAEVLASIATEDAHASRVGL